MILTIDQAFSDANFAQLEQALFDLNKVGVLDPNFLPSIEQHIQSQDSRINFEEVSRTDRSFQFHFEQ